MTDYELNTPYTVNKDSSEYIMFTIEKDLGSIEEYSKKVGGKFEGLLQKTRVVKVSPGSYAWIKKNSPSKTVHTVAKDEDRLVLVQCVHEIKVGDREFVLDPHKNKKFKGQYNLQHITRRDPDYSHVKKSRSWADDDEEEEFEEETLQKEAKSVPEEKTPSSSEGETKDTKSVPSSPDTSKRSFAAVAATPPAAAVATTPDAFPALPQRPAAPIVAVPVAPAPVAVVTEAKTEQKSAEVVVQDKTAQKMALMVKIGEHYAAIALLQAQLLAI